MGNGKIQKFIIAILALLVSATVLIAGCTQGQTKATQTAPSDSSKKPEITVQDVDIKREDPTTPEMQKQENEMMHQRMMAMMADGTYTETATYQAPPKVEEIEITIEVKDDKIVSLDIRGINPHPTSNVKQQGAEKGLRELLIGKPLSEVSIPKNVGGSSLTTAAFAKKLDELIEKY